MAQGNTETEIKLAVEGAAQARKLLRAAGFQVARTRVLEVNTVYDTPGFVLRRTSRLLRVRQAGSVATLTFKGPPEANVRHKTREELEVQLPGSGRFSTILERLGFRPAFRYEKYRTEFRPARGKGIATVDETPIGVYIELEGAPAWIDRTAHQLGFAETDYITASYGRLFLEWRRRQKQKPAHMLFAR